MRLLDALRSPLRTATSSVYKLTSAFDRRAPRPFIVLSRSRTGSNMLMSFLNSHPNVRMEGEALAELGSRSLQTVVDRLFAPPPFYVQAQGFKYFYYHPVDADPEAAKQVLAAIDGLHVLHMKRENLFHTLVSHRMADLTDVWHVPNGTDAPPALPTITLDPDAVRAGFEETRRWERDGAEAFRTRPCLTVTYEALVAHREAEFRRLTTFLNLPPVAPKTRFRKQNNRSMRDTVENYEALKTAFSGTEWASFFDE